MTDLIACIKYIRDAREKLPAVATGNDWCARNKALEELQAAILRDMPKAKINDRWDGCKVSIAGIRASSTSGLDGALANWIAAARRRLDNEGWVKTTGEKENVR